MANTPCSHLLTVSHAQAVLELRLDAQLGQPAVDLRAATMHQHRADAYCPQQDQIRNHTRLRNGSRDTGEKAGVPYQAAWCRFCKISQSWMVWQQVQPQLVRPSHHTQKCRSDVCFALPCPEGYCRIIRSDEGIRPNMTKAPGTHASSHNSCRMHYVQQSYPWCPAPHLEGGVLHGSTTILDNDCLASKSLHVGKRLSQDGNTIQLAQHLQRSMRRQVRRSAAMAPMQRRTRCLEPLQAQPDQPLKSCIPLLASIRHLQACLSLQQWPCTAASAHGCEPHAA